MNYSTLIAVVDKKKETLKALNQDLIWLIKHKKKPKAKDYTMVRIFWALCIFERWLLTFATVRIVYSEKMPKSIITPSKSSVDQTHSNSKSWVFCSSSKKLKSDNSNCEITGKWKRGNENEEMKIALLFYSVCYSAILKVSNGNAWKAPAIQSS